jgi:hypothetical protein
MATLEGKNATVWKPEMPPDAVHYFSEKGELLVAKMDSSGRIGGILVEPIQRLICV